MRYSAIKAAKTGYLTMSLVFCALGVFLMIKPDISVEIIGVILGVGLCVFGVIRLLGYFSGDIFRLAFEHDLAFGILFTALGIITLLHPDKAMSFLCVLYGIAVMADSLFKMQMSLDAKRFGIGKWWLIMLLAVLSCITGAVLVFRPYEGSLALAIVMGVSLFTDGLLNLCVGLCAVKVTKDERKIVEPEYYEIDKEDRL